MATLADKKLASKFLGWGLKAFVGATAAYVAWPKPLPVPPEPAERRVRATGTDDILILQNTLGHIPRASLPYVLQTLMQDMDRGIFVMHLSIWEGQIEMFHRFAEGQLLCIEIHVDMDGVYFCGIFLDQVLITDPAIHLSLYHTMVSELKIVRGEI